MKKAMVSNLCPCTNHHTHVNHISMADKNWLRDDWTFMNGIHRLNMSNLLQHFHKTLSDLVVVTGHESLAFFSDQLQETIIIRAAQYDDVVNLFAMDSFIVIQESIDNTTIAFKNFFRGTTNRVDTKNNYRILH